MRTFEVGDKVRVTGRFGQDKGVRTIVKVLRTRLVDDCGGRWTPDGNTLSSSRLGGSIDKVAE